MIQKNYNKKFPETVHLNWKRCNIIYDIHNILVEIVCFHFFAVLGLEHSEVKRSVENCNKSFVKYIRFSFLFSELMTERVTRKGLPSS